MKKLSLKAKKSIVQKFINVFDKYLKDSYMSFADLEFLSIRKISKLIKLSSAYSDIKTTRKERKMVAILIKSLHGPLETKSEINNIVNGISDNNVYKIIEDVIENVRDFVRKLVQILNVNPVKENDFTEDLVIRLGILRI